MGWVDASLFVWVGGDAEEWVGGRKEGSGWVRWSGWEVGRKGVSGWMRWRSGWEVGKEGEVVLGGGTDLNRCSCDTNVDSIWTEDIC